MGRLFEYVSILRHKGRDAFIAAYPHPFLLHRLLETPDMGDRGVMTANLAPGVRELLEAITAGEVKLTKDVTKFNVYPLVRRPDSLWHDRVSIGRSRSNDIIIDDKAISKTHAQLIGAFPNMRIVDLGSKNGVMLNGEKLAAKTPTPIASGDSFALGSVPFVVYDTRAFCDVLAKTLLK